MKRKGFIGLIMLLCASLLFSGCGNTTKDGNNKNNEVKTVNIGFTGPLSGGAAFYGKDVTDGLEMAVEELNKEGLNINGTQYNINLVKLDDQYLPDKAATNARRLTTEHNAQVIFVPHSGGVMALQQFNMTDKFLIMAYSSEPKITETGNTLTLRIPPRYDLYPEQFSEFTMKRYGKKVALIPTTSQYGKDWSDAFIPVWEKMGGSVVANNPVDYNKEADFYTYVSQALNSNPDVLFVGGPSQPTALIIKQARELGFKGGFIVMDQAKLDQMTDTVSMEELEGSVGASPVNLYDSEGSKIFVEKFQAKYGKLPTWESAYNYQYMMMLGKGMEKAGVVDEPEKILQGMRDIMPFNDPEMAIVAMPGFTSKGGSMGPAIGIGIENGQFTKPFIIENPDK